MRLTLYFHPSNPPELEEISFSRDGHPERIAARGKAPFRGDASGRFQWTNAVKALALLVVGSRLEQARSGDSFTISGEDHSPAASLDYAISKPTQWILDVFGADRDQRPFATRIFQRFNSERKRPGPVKITLSSGLLASGSLTIFLGERELSDPPSLSELYAALESDLSETAQTAATDGISEEDWRRAPWFEQAIVEDITDSLAETYLMEELGIREAVSRGSTFYSAQDQKVVEEFQAQILQNLPTEAQRYRPAEPDYLRKNMPEEIQLRCPPFASGALALASFLKNSFQLPLSIDWSFPGTSAILDHLDNPGIHQALVLSWNAAIKLRNAGSDTYIACALLPRTRLDVVFPPESQAPPETIYLATEKNSYPLQYLEALKTASIAEVTRLQSERASLVECITHLKRGNGASVLAFPLSAVISKIINGSLLTGELRVPRLADNVLFIDRRLDIKTRQALISAFTSGWYQLLEQPDSIRRIAREFSQSKPYTAFLQRIGGLYQT